MLVFLQKISYFQYWLLKAMKAFSTIVEFFLRYYSGASEAALENGSDFEWEVFSYECHKNSEYWNR